MAANSIAKRKIVRTAPALPIGDDRVTSGSVSDLHGMLWELEAIISGATALVESEELSSQPPRRSSMTYVENPLGAATELLNLALLRCNQLYELIQPEAANV
jgi:hypothetical protein